MAAQSLNDGAFWLPPKFLADDDVFEGTKTRLVCCEGAPTAGVFQFSCGSRTFCGVASNLNSPVESVVCSSETQSEDDEYISGLTRQMAHSTLENGSALDASTAKVLLGSPQSPVLVVENGCDCRRMDEDYLLNHHRGPSVSPVRPSHKSVRNKDSNTTEFYRRLLAAQFQHLRQQQMLNQQSSSLWGNEKKTTGQNQRHRQYQSQMARSKGCNGEIGHRRNCHPLALSPYAWPLLPDSQYLKHGSGMRAVFLDNPDGKRECIGTGVFWPRKISNHSVTHKKPAFSTALVPAKVIQALNLNLDEMRVHPQIHRQFVPDRDAALRFQIDSLRSHPECVNHELRLPNEWTY